MNPLHTVQARHSYTYDMQMYKARQTVINMKHPHIIHLNHLLEGRSWYSPFRTYKKLQEILSVSLSRANNLHTNLDVTVCVYILSVLTKLVDI